MAEPNTEPFRICKVEEFFSDYQSWNTLGKMELVNFDERTRVLQLKSTNTDNEECVLLMHFPRIDTFRVRFNPGKKTIKNYPMFNNRTIICDSMDLLNETLERYLYKFTIECVEQRDMVNEEHDKIVITTHFSECICAESEANDFMKVEVYMNPYRLKVYRYKASHSTAGWFEVHTDEKPSIYYKKRIVPELNNAIMYSIINVKEKGPMVKFSGFGEHGFTGLCKNEQQLNFFQYDNTAYRQFYDQGGVPDVREPFYHGDPFFLCFYSNPGIKSVQGIFIDNMSQTFVDTGVVNTGKYMFGSVLNDLDYYFYLGEDARDVVGAHVTMVGQTRLKPRWVLGYHQGCHGYMSRSGLEYVVGKHRDYRIPLDGIHLDVGLQDNYCTFTIDNGRFNDAEEMFSQLADNGIKCSANITPVVSNRGRNNPNEEYKTYQDGINENRFLRDERTGLRQGDYDTYAFYEGGHENKFSYEFCGPGSFGGKYDNVSDEERRSWFECHGADGLYLAEVFYGEEEGLKLGTTGHCPDLYTLENRRWWGTQYEYLFAMGLEMIWQDMTTPYLTKERGDMKSFPFKLMVKNDFVRKSPGKKVPVLSTLHMYSYNLHKATYHGLNNLVQSNNPLYAEKLHKKRILERKENGETLTLNKRNFVLGRDGYSGMHRFAGLWTGDNFSTWDYLRGNVTQALAIGMTGQSITAADVGGFEPSEAQEKWVEPELLIRWVTCGAFLPWFRNHYNRRMHKKYFQEIFEYQEVLSNENSQFVDEADRHLYESVVPICRYAINLRYHLMQLFYDAMYENTIDGLPIARAMFLSVDDGALFTEKKDFLNNQFFVGEDMLIAPILEKGQTHRDIYLPDKRESWYHFKNNFYPLDGRLEGGTVIRGFNASISTEDQPRMMCVVPIYVRGGAVIPTIEVEQWTGERNALYRPNPITFNIYPGDRKGRGKDVVATGMFAKLCSAKKLSDRGSYTTFQDDGLSRESASILFQKSEPLAQGRYRTIDVDHKFDTHEPKKRLITVEYNKHRLHPDDLGYTPEYENFIFVSILHDPTEPGPTEHIIDSAGPLERVTVNGRAIRLVLHGDANERADQLWNSPEDSWYHNDTIRISFVKIFENEEKINNGIRIEAIYHKPPRK